MAGIDWNYWRHKFVTGEMSLKELSEGHGAPAFKTLRNKSSAEDWPSQRKHFRDMKGTQAAIVPDVRQTAETVTKIIDAAEMLTQHNQIAKLLISKGVQAVREIDPAKLSPRDALAFLKEAVAIQRLTEGLATERLDVEQKATIEHVKPETLKAILEDVYNIYDYDLGE